MASRVKSISFKQTEDNLLTYVESKADFSEYIKGLIKEDMQKGYKPPKELETYIINLIKKYAPQVKDEDIKHNFDEDAVAALEQFK